MDNTANRICRCVVSLLEKHGVRHAVVSPGSRNAPLLIALSRKPGITTYNIVDERSAAFVALGLSIASGSPVALVCTSGTASLNYAPAVAEAFYRKVPLIVVSADRPKEWIGQDDSQTIRQDGALANIVKRSYDINAAGNEPDLWYANRVT
ncbi:MAG: thiamine pyrophosphate-binding protein, partial [Paramuribaculum sp.]